MPIATASDLLAALLRLGVLDDAQAGELRGAPPTPDARGLAKDLLRRGWLTPYQANQLLQGHGDALVLGPYLLLERLGAGGMGQVFKARHRKLGRVVAVKVIRKERLQHPEAVRRFLREVRAAAQLNHPNVVIAFDAEEASGVHFLAMEFVEGMNLDQLVKQRGPLPIAEACECVRQAALGLEHAHDQGLVHRDVKPSNLLRAAHGGVVKVLDLGLARVQTPLPEEESGTLTQEGVVMGTPDYIAPEQVDESHEVDGRADVYSLGCTFFFLLTGQPPFAGGSVGRKLSRHLTAEPPPLHTLRLDAPPALAAVVRRMMAKNPADRFQSPAEVARALEAFTASVPLTGAPEPRAVPPDPAPTYVPPETPFTGAARRDTTETATPIRRPKGLKAAWLMLGAAMLLGSLTLAALLWVLLRPHPPGPPPPPPPPTAVPPLDLLRADALPASERYPWQPPELVAVLGNHSPRHLGAAGGVNAVACSGDGVTVASLGNGGKVMVWDAQTGRDRPSLVVQGTPCAMTFTPNGAQVVFACADHVVRLCDVIAARSGKEILLKGHTDGVVVVAVAPDGRTMATAGKDKTVRVWDLTRPRPEETAVVLSGPEDVVRGLAFAPDGKTLAAGGDDGRLRLWFRDGATWREKAVIPEGAAVVGVGFAPDGGTVLAGCKDGFVRLADLEGATIQPRSGFRAQEGAILAFAVAPKGRTLAVAGLEGTIRLWSDWQRETPTLAGSFQGHAGAVDALAFLSDDKSFVSGGKDLMVRFWDRTPDGWRERGPPRGHVKEISALAFTPDGQALLSADVGHIVRRWDLAAPEAEGGRIFPQEKETFTGMTFLPDRNTLATVCPSAVRFWDVTEDPPREKSVVRAHESFVHSAAISRDGKTLAVAADRSIALWTLAKNPPERLATLRDFEADLNGMALAPDGNALVSCETPGRMRLWRLDNGRWTSRTVENGHKGTVYGVVFTPDGKTAISAGNDKTVRMWDAVEGRPTADPVLGVLPDTIVALALAPDGKTLAAQCEYGTLVWWDLPSRTKRGECVLPCRADALVFAADGRHLAVGAQSGVIYLFRLAPADR